ncbi:hypothetical protein HD554DRAFT_2017726, partial [Boletus coccyginus]
VVKFMPCFDGPYHVIHVDHMTSMYTLDMPACLYVSPTFHISQLHAFHANNDTLFPTHMVSQPKPVLTAEGYLKHCIDHILEEQQVGCGCQYLVQWSEFGVEDDEWLLRKELLDCEALDVWKKSFSYGGRI